MSDKPRVVILGGGLIGSLANLILRDICNVTVVERRSRRGFNPLPKFNAIFSFKPREFYGIEWREITCLNCIDSERVSEEGISRYKNTIKRQHEEWKLKWFVDHHTGYMISELSECAIDNHLFSSEVGRVDLSEKFLQVRDLGNFNRERALRYDILINTLPAPIFNESLRSSDCIPPTLGFEGNLIFIRRFLNCPNMIGDDIFYLNVVTSTPEIYRYSYLGSMTVYESINPISDGFLMPEHQEVIRSEGEDTRVFPGKIYTNTEWTGLESAYAGVSAFHVGRYAEYKSYLRTEDAIDKLLKIRESIIHSAIS